MQEVTGDVGAWIYKVLNTTFSRGWWSAECAAQHVGEHVVWWRYEGVAAQAHALNSSRTLHASNCGWPADMLFTTCGYEGTAMRPTRERPKKQENMPTVLDGFAGRMAQQGRLNTNLETLKSCGHLPFLCTSKRLLIVAQDRSSLKIPCEIFSQEQHKDQHSSFFSFKNS